MKDKSPVRHQTAAPTQRQSSTHALSPSSSPGGTLRRRRRSSPSSCISNGASATSNFFTTNGEENNHQRSPSGGSGGGKQHPVATNGNGTTCISAQQQRQTECKIKLSNGCFNTTEQQPRAKSPREPHLNNNITYLANSERGLNNYPSRLNPFSTTTKTDHTTDSVSTKKVTEQHVAARLTPPPPLPPRPPVSPLSLSISTQRNEQRWFSTKSTVIGHAKPVLVDDDDLTYANGDVGEGGEESDGNKRVGSRNSRPLTLGSAPRRQTAQNSAGDGKALQQPRQPLNFSEMLEDALREMDGILSGDSWGFFSNNNNNNVTGSSAKHPLNVSSCMTPAASQHNNAATVRGPSPTALPSINNDNIFMNNFAKGKVANGVPAAPVMHQSQSVRFNLTSATDNFPQVNGHKSKEKQTVNSELTMVNGNNSMIKSTSSPLIRHRTTAATATEKNGVDNLSVVDLCRLLAERIGQLTQVQPHNAINGIETCRRKKLTPAEDSDLIMISDDEDDEIAGVNYSRAPEKMSMQHASIDANTKHTVLNFLVRGRPDFASKSTSSAVNGTKDADLEIFVLASQIDAQAAKIKDLEMSLHDKRAKLEQTETLMQQEVMNRSHLETIRLELSSQINDLKLRLTANEKEKTMLDERVRLLQSELGTIRSKTVGDAVDGVNNRMYRTPSREAVHNSDGKDLMTHGNGLQRTVERLLASNDEKDRRIDQLQLALRAQLNLTSCLKATTTRHQQQHAVAVDEPRTPRRAQSPSYSRNKSRIQKSRGTNAYTAQASPQQVFTNEGSAALPPYRPSPHATANGRENGGNASSYRQQSMHQLHMTPPSAAYSSLSVGSCPADRLRSRSETRTKAVDTFLRLASSELDIDNGFGPAEHGQHFRAKAIDEDDDDDEQQQQQQEGRSPYSTATASGGGRRSHNTTTSSACKPPLQSAASYYHVRRRRGSNNAILTNSSGHCSRDIDRGPPRLTYDISNVVMRTPHSSPGRSSVGISSNITEMSSTAPYLYSNRTRKYSNGSCTSSVSAQQQQRRHLPDDGFCTKTLPLSVMKQQHSRSLADQSHMYESLYSTPVELKSCHIEQQRVDYNDDDNSVCSVLGPVQLTGRKGNSLCNDGRIVFAITNNRYAVKNNFKEVLTTSVSRKRVGKASSCSDLLVTDDQSLLTASGSSPGTGPSSFISAKRLTPRDNNNTNRNSAHTSLIITDEGCTITQQADNINATAASNGAIAGNGAVRNGGIHQKSGHHHHHQPGSWKKWFGKLKSTSNSNLSAELPDEKNQILMNAEPQAFRRGGVRATAGPMLERNGHFNHNNYLRSKKVRARLPLAQWDKEDVMKWIVDDLELPVSVQARQYIHDGAQLLEASPLELECEMCFRNLMHRKKLQLALREAASLGQTSQTGGSRLTPSSPAGRLDHHWVAGWLVDIGLPQYRKLFFDSRIDGRVLAELTTNDLLYMKIALALHHASIKRSVQVLFNVGFRSDYFVRSISAETNTVINTTQPQATTAIATITLLENGDATSAVKLEASTVDINKDSAAMLTKPATTDEDAGRPERIMLWSCDRVRHWLRANDMSEYANSVGDCGVNGALFVLEPLFNADVLAEILGIPINKSLVRRHLRTQFSLLVGADVIKYKREHEQQPGYAPLNMRTKVKPTRKVFSLSRSRSKQHADLDDDYLYLPTQPMPDFIQTVSNDTPSQA